MENNENKVLVSLAAIDPYIQQNIPVPTEKVLSGKNMVEWGTGNAYPDYLLELCRTTPTLRSIITGTVDFICGNGCALSKKLVDTYKDGQVNTKGETIAEQIRQIADDDVKLGGLALQVIRSKTGDIVEIYYINTRFLRSNKDNTVFYYSEDLKASHRKVIEYPAFYPHTKESWAALSEQERDRNVSSILYVKNDRSQVYPQPVYCAALKACEIERNIDDFHLNSLENSFTSSMIINFNNGTPSDEMKKEIEKGFNEKFSGHENAGRIVYSWNPDVKNQTTITAPKVEDFGARYDALSKHSRQQIFTSFRANPNLFGIPTENLGFSQEEYESAFRLYNRTVVRPIQALICDAYDKIFGDTGVLTIVPFSLDEETEKNVN